MSVVLICDLILCLGLSYPFSSSELSLSLFWPLGLKIPLDLMNHYPHPQLPEKFVMYSSTDLDILEHRNQSVYTMKNILTYCFGYPEFPVWSLVAPTPFLSYPSWIVRTKIVFYFFGISCWKTTPTSMNMYFVHLCLVYLCFQMTVIVHIKHFTIEGNV